MSNRFNLFEPIFSPIPHQTLSLKHIKKPHMWEVEIWRYHRKIDSFKSTNKKEIKRWIKKYGYDDFYNYGECMIYIKINGTHIIYWAFMKNKYYLD